MAFAVQERTPKACHRKIHRAAIKNKQPTIYKDELCKSVQSIVKKSFETLSFILCEICSDKHEIILNHLYALYILSLPIVIFM